LSPGEIVLEQPEGSSKEYLLQSLKKEIVRLIGTLIGFSKKRRGKGFSAKRFR